MADYSFKLIKPIMNGRMFLSHQTAPNGWSTQQDISEYLGMFEPTFSTGEISIADPSYTGLRFVVYFDSPTTLSYLPMLKLSKNSGLSFTVFGDDQSVGAWPTTALGSAHTQGAESAKQEQPNEYITFPETTATCFMVEVQGLDAINGDEPVNILANSGGVSLGQSSGTYDEVESLNTPVSESQVFRLSINWDVISDPVSTEDPDYAYLTVSVDNFFQGEFIADESDGLVQTEILFNVPAGAETFDVSISATGSHQSGDSVNLNSIELKSNAYIEPLDVAKIIWGKEAFEPENNHSWGYTHGGGRSVDVVNSAERAWPIELDEPQRWELPCQGFSTQEIHGLFDVWDTLVAGICVIDQNPTSSSYKSKMLGILNLSEASAEHLDTENTTITLTELIR